MFSKKIVKLYFWHFECCSYSSAQDLFSVAGLFSTECRIMSGKNHFSRDKLSHNDPVYTYSAVVTTLAMKSSSSPWTFLNQCPKEAKHFKFFSEKTLQGCFGHLICSFDITVEKNFWKLQCFFLQIFWRS